MADRSLISGDFISAGYLGNNFISGSLVFTPSRDLPANEILVKIATFSTSSYVEIGSAVDPNLFITTWRTTVDNEDITIPTAGSGYDYTVTTSDGRTFTNTTGNQSITFATAGDYDVSISGTFPRIFFNNVGDKTKIIDIKQWGNIAWTSFSGAFRGCSNLVGNYTDAPDLSGVVVLNNSFRECSVFTGKVSNWDVSNVNNMRLMFYYASSFNGNLSAWNVSNVNNMNGMFANTSFNQDIGSWDVSSVTNMSSMFYGAQSFNQDIGSWDITKVSTFADFLRVDKTLSTTNYDALLVGWVATLDAYVAAGNTYTLTPTAGFGNAEYTSGGAAEAARTKLQATYGWTVTDGGAV